MKIKIQYPVYISGIYQLYTASRIIHGIYVVYTYYIPRWGSRWSSSRLLEVTIWNRDRLYENRVFGTYLYVPVCTEYIQVRNAENGTYQYVLVFTSSQYVQVL